MNKWVQKSIELAKSNGYLDKLFEIYPIEVGSIREISPEAKKRIETVFKSKNKKELLKEILKLQRFPFDDPYVASLKKHPYLLDKNPQTIKRISEKLLSLGLKSVLKLAVVPKSPSRQLGSSFKNWLPSLGFPLLEEEKFKNYKGRTFLKGSDKILKDFASKNLRVKNLKKGIDFIFKSGGRFILGEAKFLTDYGGTQNNQFRDAISLTKIKKDKIIGIALLDGIVWFESSSYMHRKAKSVSGVALSALLLDRFIKENY